ncbi:MAG: PQQ-binding-like beta-propeller repeat protein [Thermodesulfovibrionales bacterium]|nr:PQQ-binding-like beta-propeller repeat protein [Thermodesulfovibrionales bacterium]
MSNKPLFIVLLLCLVNLPLTGFAQITWEKTFGGTDWDIGCFITETPDQCYIIGGETKSFGSGGDIYALKIDKAGNVLWEKYFGEEDYEYGEAIAKTLDENFVIIGNTYYGEENPIEDAYVIKVDASGNLLWKKRFGGKGCEQVFSVKQTSDNGCIMCGGTTSFSEDFNIYVIRLDKDGEIIWEKAFGSEEEEVGTSILSLTNDSFIVLAYRGPEESRDIYLLKLDRDGNVILEKTIDIDTSIFPLSIDKTSDGGYVISGYKGILGENCLYVAKINAEGDLIWDATFEGGIARSIKEATDGNYIVAGTIYTSEGRGNDVCLLKLDNSGNLIWEKTYGGNDDDLGLALQLLPDGGYIIVGQTLSFGKGESDVYVLKVDAEGNLQKE